MEFMRESDSPIKQDLSDIPHVAKSENISFFFFFLNNVHKMERAGGGKGWVDCGWGVSFQNACLYEENSQSVFGDIALCSY